MSQYIADSGSVADIQAAVDLAAAAGGGDVYVPEGTWEFDADGATRVDMVGGVNLYGQGYSGQVGRAGLGTATFNTILRMPQGMRAGGYSDHTTMISCVGTNGKPIRICGIRLVGRSWGGYESDCGDTGISIDRVTNFRVDHCAIESLGSNGVGINQSSNTGWGGGSGTWSLCQGVVDHCDILNMLVNPAVTAGTGFGYGVGVDKKDGTSVYVWNQTPSDLTGTYWDNVYVEDCYINDPRHAICNVLGGVSIFRYNVVVYGERSVDGGSWCTDQHPPRAYTGGRWMEVYQNIFHGAGDHWCHGVGYYGGGGVCCNNVFWGESGMYWGHVFGATDATTQAIWDLGKTHDVYLWNNTYHDVASAGEATPYYYVEGPPGGIVGAAPTLNVDFFFRAPNTTDDGWSWSPYTYPHPLITGETPTYPEEPPDEPEEPPTEPPPDPEPPPPESPVVPSDPSVPGYWPPLPSPDQGSGDVQRQWPAPTMGPKDKAHFGVARFGYSRFSVYNPVIDNQVMSKLKNVGVGGTDKTVQAVWGLGEWGEFKWGVKRGDLYRKLLSQLKKV